MNILISKDEHEAIIECGSKCLRVKVSVEDIDRVISMPTWQQLPSGYVYTKVKKKHVYLHRFIMGAKEGDPQIDHKNRDKTDCTRQNLKYATSRQQVQNTDRSDNASSKFKGVSKSGKLWKAYIFDGKSKMLGQFKSEILAAICYDSYLLNTLNSLEETNYHQGLYSLEDLMVYGLSSPFSIF